MKKLMVLCGILCAVLLGCEKEVEKTNVETTVQETPVVETPKVEVPEVEEEEKEEAVVETPKVEVPEVEEEEKDEAVVQEEQNVFPLGHRIGNDKIEVVFFNAYYTDDRNQFSDIQADKVLIIEYEYKNINAGDEFALFEGTHFQVYDGDGYRLDTYPATETYYGGQVSEGRSAKSSEAFAVVGDQTHYEIEIGGCIIEFDLE